jgi:hypothetical protein
MFKVLKRVSRGYLFKKSSMTQAMRTIKDFEKVNKCKFDPFNRCHADIVDGQGSVGGAIRSVQLKLKSRNIAQTEG